MDFGYFTLTDNRYTDNPRSAADLACEIAGQGIYADQIGMHSVWIGEHHFNRLGCLPAPEVMLSYIAARTERIRLAPAVVVLPLHHPLRVAEQWATLDALSGGRVNFAAGRGFDGGEYAPFGADFENSFEVLTEGMDILRRAWSESEPWSHKGKHYAFEDVIVTPCPVQDPVPVYMGCFSQPTLEFTARNGYHMGMTAFGAKMNYGGLGPMVEAYREACVKHDKAPGRTMTSFLIHMSNNEAEDREGRERCLRYFVEDAMTSVPADPANTPDNLKYFLKFSSFAPRLAPEDLDDSTILLGRPQQIIDSLANVVAAGLDEVVLYFGYGLKPDSMVRDQMAWFMQDVAPHFENTV